MLAWCARISTMHALVGTNLEGANLEGERRSMAFTWAWCRAQLAGANLRDASLPESIWEFGAATEFRQALA